ncbi:MAG: PAS domain S-box protein [Cyanobacteriota bacterium]|nr:PAS domain S-box protein [Cyanobacteriota bacterium]
MSRQDFKSLFLNAPTGIFCAEWDGTFQQINPALAKLFGYASPTQMKAHISHASGYYRDPHRNEQLRQQLTQQGSLESVESQAIRQGGQIIWIRERLKLLIDPKGSPPYIQGFVEDITTHKQDQLNQIDQRNIQQALLNAIPDSLIRLSPEGEYLDMRVPNLNYSPYFPPHPETWRGRTVRDMLPPELAEKAYDALQRVFISKQPEVLDYEIVMDGKTYYRESRVVPLGEQEILVLVRDVTARKQAELAVHEREAMLRALGDNLPHALIYQFEQSPAHQLHFTHISAGCESVCEEQSQDLMQQPERLFAQILPGDQPQFQAVYQSALKLRQAFIHQCRLQTPSGKLKWIEIRCHPRNFDNGHTLWNGIVFDITDQKMMQKELEVMNANLDLQVEIRTQQLHIAWQFESVLRRIIENVRDTLDEDKILQTAINELGATLGLTYANIGIYNSTQTVVIVKYEYKKLSIPSINSQKDLYLIQQLQKGWSFQFCLLSGSRSSGKWDPNYVYLLCPMLDNQQALGDLMLLKPASLSFTDWEINLVEQIASQCAIALRQARLYQAAQVQVKELEKINTLKDDFVATISHELRTPLSNMRMAIRMLQSSLRHFPVHPKQQQYLNLLDQECDREITLVSDLLNLQNFDARNQRIYPESINFHQWLSRIILPFIDKTNQQNQQLIVEQESHPIIIQTDRIMLERVICELLTNACKYTPSGQQILVSARKEKESHTLLVRVTNTGVELPVDQWDRIFERFYRIPNSDPWKQGGTGLGLALVKQSVAYMKGSIAVESREGSTTFSLCLPLIYSTKQIST